jgi:hypothetical protein
MNLPLEPTEALVRVRRPDGREFLLRVPGEHLQRVMDLAAGEFGDKTIKGIEGHGGRLDQDGTRHPG